MNGGNRLGAWAELQRLQTENTDSATPTLTNNDIEDNEDYNIGYRLQPPRRRIPILFKI